MNYILTRKNFPKPLLENLPQRNTALCDLKLVFDHGEVWIHRTVLQMWQVWWSSLLQDSKTNIVLLPGVSKFEVEHFLSNVYRGKLNFSPTDDSDDEKESFYGFTDMEIAETKRLKPIASYWRPWQETRTNAGGEQGEVAMEKIRPIENKLKYQINKCVSLAETGHIDSDDPSRFKPNPKQLASKFGDDDGDSSDNEDVTSFSWWACYGHDLHQIFW